MPHYESVVYAAKDREGVCDVVATLYFAIFIDFLRLNESERKRRRILVTKAPLIEIFQVDSDFHNISLISSTIILFYT